MDTKDLLKFQLEASAHQIDKVLEGLPDDKWDGKIRDDCMSPRETVTHLTECYIAAKTDIAGGKHEWGSYVPEEEEVSAITAKMNEERTSLKEAVLASDNEKVGEIASQYAMLHDAYHVGQLAIYRMGVDPEWDAYSIYS